MSTGFDWYNYPGDFHLRYGSNELDSSSPTARSSPVMLRCAQHLSAPSSQILRFAQDDIVRSLRLIPIGVPVG